MRLSPKEILELTVKKGDVFTCEGGEPGRCAVWEGQENFYVYQKALHRVRVNQNLNPYWLTYCLKTKADSGKLAEQFTGTTIKHFTGAELSKLAILLPSLLEQLEIVSRVETLFDLAHDLETRINTARDQLEKLTPALLAKAFRGELVPQDPTDEPASVLLERIRAAREMQPTTKPERKPRTPRTKPLKAGGESVKRLEDVPSDHLTQTIKERGPNQNALEAKTLWQASDLNIDDFYQQLSREVSGGLLRVNGDQPAIIEAA